MDDFDQYRVNMVDNQIRTSDVTDPELLAALATVPREEFVAQHMRTLAYIDEDLSLGGGRYLMEPAPFAKLVQACEIKPDDIVLDIGCGSGYSSAVMSRISSLVIAVEQDEKLADAARQTLSALHFDNTAVINGHFNLGYAKQAPYDVIFVGGAVEEIPLPLFEQLKNGGRLVAVVGYGNSAAARLYTSNDGNVSSRVIFNCAIKPLPGFAKTREFSL